MASNDTRPASEPTSLSVRDMSNGSSQRSAIVAPGSRTVSCSGRRHSGVADEWSPTRRGAKKSGLSSKRWSFEDDLLDRPDRTIPVLALRPERGPLQVDVDDPAALVRDEVDRLFPIVSDHDVHSDRIAGRGHLAFDRETVMLAGGRDRLRASGRRRPRAPRPDSIRPRRAIQLASNARWSMISECRFDSASGQVESNTPTAGPPCHA